MRKILIIDDDAIYHKIIQKLLCNVYKLIFADNHLDALKIIKNDVPDMIIADLNMPGIEGEQLIELIKSTLGNENVPVLVISGMDDDCLKERLFSMGISKFITKPIDRNILKNEIADILGVSYVG